MKKYPILLVALSLFASACEKEPDTLNLLSEDKVTVAAGASTFDIRLESNLDIEVVLQDKWVSEVKAKTIAESVFTFQVQANDTYSPRKTVITFKNQSAGLSVQVNVSQKQNEAILLEQTEASFTAEGGAVTLTARSNVDISVRIPEEATNWLSCTGNKALVARTLTFSALPNTGYEARRAVVSLYNEAAGLSQNVTLTQAQQDVLQLTADHIELEVGGGAFTVETEGNVPVQVAQIQGDWIHQDSANKGLVKNSFSFIADENPTFSTRQGTIVFSGAGQTVYFSVAQAARQMESVDLGFVNFQGLTWDSSAAGSQWICRKNEAESQYSFGLVNPAGHKMILVSWKMDWIPLAGEEVSFDVIQNVDKSISPVLQDVKMEVVEIKERNMILKGSDNAAISILF